MTGHGTSWLGLVGAEAFTLSRATVEVEDVKVIVGAEVALEAVGRLLCLLPGCSVVLGSQENGYCMRFFCVGGRAKPNQKRIAFVEKEGVRT